MVRPAQQANSSRGFTLIELLVVIAIIGILSSVVLASLNTARTKGNDAAVKANLSSVSTQAALYLSDNSNSYGTFAIADCPTPGTAGSTVFNEPTVEKAVAAALLNSPGGAAKCVSDSTDYAVAVNRPDTTNSTYWCVDSKGNHCGINSMITTPTCGTTCTQ
ncbi:MAG: type II secretion system protein [Candidatus Paceibacterota bacterium]|jgi:prepilin-type N-terminal cleavage/methylation domain-containing protein